MAQHVLSTSFSSSDYSYSNSITTYQSRARNNNNNIFKLFLSVFLILFLCPYCSACKNLTLESCTTSSDCIGGDSSVPSFACAGRDRKTNQLMMCPNNMVDKCVCYPLNSFRYCERNTDCPDEMYCGISPRSGNKICVGCLILRDKEMDFKPVDPKTYRRCRNQHPPCGRGLDYCSSTMPCKQGYNCVHWAKDEAFQCSADSTPCNCYLPGDGKFQIALQACTSNDECPDERESCAYDLQSHRNLCTSCDIINASPYLIANNTLKCDSLKSKRNPPRNYVKSSNGRNFDLCYEDSQCTNERKCVKFKTSYLQPKKVEPCTDPGELCFCRPKTLMKCKSGDDCQRGESCAIAKVVGANEHCVSNSFLDSLSRDRHTIVGQFRYSGIGKGLTSDPCQFDWDCKLPRRCTYTEDSYGGCAGRTSCTCQPLIDRPCQNDDDCKSGESCYAFDHKSTQSTTNSNRFCVSPHALRLQQYYERRFLGRISSSSHSDL